MDSKSRSCITIVLLFYADVDFSVVVEKDGEKKTKRTEKISVGGEHNSVAIDGKDLIIGTDGPFDSGSTCEMYKGTFHKNGIPIEVACKKFGTRMTPKFRRRLDKEARSILQLNHPNVLLYFGIDYRVRILGKRS